MHLLERLGGVVNRCFAVSLVNRLAVSVNGLFILVGKRISLSIFAFADGNGGFVSVYTEVFNAVAVFVGVGVDVL